MNDLLTESEVQNENRFMRRYLFKLILVIGLFLIAYHAYGCPYEKLEPIKIEVKGAI